MVPASSHRRLELALLLWDWPCSVVIVVHLSVGGEALDIKDRLAGAPGLPPLSQRRVALAMVRFFGDRGLEAFRQRARGICWNALGLRLALGQYQ